MRRIIYRNIAIGAVVAIGLLMRSGGVNAGSVLDCQILKLKAAGDRVKCLTTEEAKKLKGLPFNLAGCEAQFDAAIAAAGTACRYIDNGNGTVSDLNTLLMWEKKVSGSSSSIDSRGIGNCLHCVNDRYAWTPAMHEWLSAVNGRTNSNIGQTGFAGFEDWRMPTMEELTKILGCTVPGPTGACIDPIFGPTNGSATTGNCVGSYWSSTTADFNPKTAWILGFTNGGVGTAFKNDPDNHLSVRAVRGGR
jgi:hypothetical protein